MSPDDRGAQRTLAAYGEHQFVQRHRDGVGPTARWAVSDHWLSYDARTQILSGSD